MASSTLRWTDATGQIHMNSAAYQRLLKTKSDNSLKYIIKDATEAMEAMPQGNNAGYYADEVSYAAMELNTRNAKRNAWQRLATCPVCGWNSNECTCGDGAALIN